MTQHDDDKIGFGHPPKARRFKPGQSGNPRGRPKGARGVSAILEAALAKRITVTENGIRRRISKLDAAVQQVVNKAAGGNEKAVKLIMEMIAHGERANQPVDGEMSAGAQKARDAAILELLKTQMQSLVSKDEGNE
jgi:hypothetical protein